MYVIARFKYESGVVIFLGMKPRCVICGRDDVPLLEARHKKLGVIWVCQECWTKLFERNEFLVGGGEKCSCG